MLDAEGGKGLRNIEKIKIENDLGIERWYKANKFILYAEAVAYLNGKVAENAPENALEDATPNGVKMMREADAAAGRAVRVTLEIGEAAAAGFGLNNEKARKAPVGIGLNYGA